MVNIVVVCWNAVNYSIIAIESLIESLRGCEDYQITIINNGSVDETSKFLGGLSNNKKIKIIENSENIGIGAAYNQGYEESKKIGAKYTVFCNNDLLFPKNWMGKMKSIMEQNDNIAMLGSLIPSSNNFYDEEKTTKEVLLSLTESNSPQEELSKFFGGDNTIEIFQERVRTVNLKKYGENLRRVNFPNAISSCCVMTRTAVFDKFGWFANPDFKEYGGEDIDTCWRVIKAGYEIAITNEVYIHHFRGKSIKVANFNRKELLKKSNRKLFNIWKKDIVSYYKSLGITTIDQIPNTPDNWLINEIKNDINLDEELKNE